MIEFITSNWQSIIVILAFILLVVVLAIRGKKQIIYKMLYALVHEAEDRYGSGTGSLKYAEVMTKIYSMLPPIIKFFITYETLDGWIEKQVAILKKELEEKAGIKDG